MIKRSVGFSLAVISLSLLAGASIALQPGGPGGGQPPQPGQQPGQPGPGKRAPGEGRGGPRGEGVSLENAMKGMNRAMRTLKAQIADAGKKDENLRLLGEVQRFAVLSKGQPLPAKVLEHAKDDAAKADMSKWFRADLIAIVRLALDAEEAVLAGKTADAAAKLDEMAKRRDAAHDRLGIKEEEPAAAPPGRGG